MDVTGMFSDFSMSRFNVLDVDGWRQSRATVSPYMTDNLSELHSIKENMPLLKYT